MHLFKFISGLVERSSRLAGSQLPVCELSINTDTLFIFIL